MSDLSAVCVQRNVRIPLSDGISLSADIFLPAAATKACGAAIEYLPYRKDDLLKASEWRHRALAAAGIAAVRVDIRGTGSSTGDAFDEYSSQEQKDAVEAIAWLANQPWCNGNIGIWGASYGGFNAVQIAALNPEHLKAVVAVHFTDDRYTDDVHYGGGSLRQWDWTNYAHSMVARTGLPPDPAYDPDTWLDTWAARFESEPWALEWLRQQSDGPYWRAGSISEDYSSIKCATYLIGGWHDGYRNAPLRTFAALQCPKKVLMGPWSHNFPDEGIPGPRIDFVRELTRWFGYWLNGTATGILDEKPVTIFMHRSQAPNHAPESSPGTWVAIPNLPDLDQREFFLDASGTLTSTPGGSVQNVTIPDAAWAGVWGGVWCPANPPRMQAGDQRLEEPWSVRFTSEPLAEPLTLLGRPNVRLRLSALDEIAQVSVRLCDVSPDGASTLVTRAVLNLTRRDGMSRPSPIPRGETVEIPLDLDTIAWEFPAGHRLRLLVMSSDWPNVWPTPRLPGLGLVLDPKNPCSLTLPLVHIAEDLSIELPEQPDQTPGEIQPASQAEWAYRYRAIPDSHEVRTLAATEFQIPERGIRVEDRQEGTVRVNGRNRAHATAEGQKRYTVEWPGLTVVSDAYTSLVSDETHFRALTKLDVKVDGHDFKQLWWTANVRRDLM